MKYIYVYLLEMYFLRSNKFVGPFLFRRCSIMSSTKLTLRDFFGIVQYPVDQVPPSSGCVISVPTRKKGEMLCLELTVQIKSNSNL